MSAALRLCLTLVLIGAPAWAGEKNAVVEGTPGYEVLVTDARKGMVAVYAPDGRQVWSCPSHHCIDAWPLPDGAAMITFNPSPETDNKGGVRIVSRDKKVVFEYRTEGEVMSCQPLEDGNLLVSKNTQGELAVIDREGKELLRVPVKSKGMGHKTVRLTRQTPAGTFLAAECYSNALREYDRAGNLVRDIEARGAFSGQRLENGNTVISCYFNPRVIEVDPDGKVVWELKPEDLPPDARPDHFGEAVRLANGNTLVCNYYGKPGPTSISLFEITPEKKIAWSLRDPERLAGVTAAKPISK